MSMNYVNESCGQLSVQQIDIQYLELTGFSGSLQPTAQLATLAIFVCKFALISHRFLEIQI
jgi:hypothetical protein